MRAITERDGAVIIEPGVRHLYRRADHDVSGESEEERLLGVPKEVLEQDVVMVELTQPAGRDKEFFFRQFLSLLEEMKGDGIGEIAWMSWSSFVVFCGHDNYPVVVGVSRRFGEALGKGVEWAITHTLLGVATFCGRLVGLKSTYDGYTPFGF